MIIDEPIKLENPIVKQEIQLNNENPEKNLAVLEVFSQFRVIGEITDFLEIESTISFNGTTI